MHIEVFQDLVCPWCRIGKKNLLDAAAAWQEKGGEPLTITYRAFQLNPELPPEGKPFIEEMAAKAGGIDNIRRMTEQVTEAGAAVGVVFHFDKVDRMPNTRLGHRIVAIAPDSAKAPLVDAFYRAYFEEGLDIAQRPVLLAAAAAAGLDPDALTARLENGEGDAAVDGDLADAQAIGVTGVPFFVVNRKYALSGAYPPAQLLAMMERVAQEAQDGTQSGR